MAIITGITPYGETAFPIYEVADMTAEITYADALKLALPWYSRFYDYNDWMKANNDDKSYEWHKFHDNELQMRSWGCCAAIDMVQCIFHVSDDQIHEDLDALRQIGA